LHADSTTTTEAIISEALMRSFLGIPRNAVGHASPDNNTHSENNGKMAANLNLLIAAPRAFGRNLEKPSPE